MQEKAVQFATDLGITTFVASNGWLQSFVKRNNLAFGKLCGESGDVDGDVVTTWKERLPKLIEGYDERDIFNMDESGLFFKTSAVKSFYIKGEKCGGGKKSKERITISLCANLLGEKEELVFIGKSARPRAFGSLNISDLPVIYKNSRKAWMTTKIFTYWLMGFNEKMKQQNRHVLLFLDNAPAHPTKQFSNVKLQFFPANTTSVLQTLDEGVIQAVKL
ncbi:tigger transposable element-derived protein 6 [Elysia marginata]|uniref:Tigger transposable element-derived protein 6 n=1 Tax=Elysia marginata TaxID=1093978 RepID=A0AAV4EIB3_9GAST|nr:tigger transposable element-derived protein 6 [Elysia marginata]